jgi:hypothetical protein
MENAQKTIDELRTEKKKLFERIVAANKVLRKMPLEDVVYCGSCGAKMKIPLSTKRSEWFEALRQALLFSAGKSQERVDFFG